MHTGKSIMDLCFTDILLQRYITCRKKTLLCLSGCIPGRKYWSWGSGKHNKNVPDAVFISPRFITAKAKHNHKQWFWFITLLTVRGCWARIGWLTSISSRAKNCPPPHVLRGQWIRDSVPFQFPFLFCLTASSPLLNIWPPPLLPPSVIPEPAGEFFSFLSCYFFHLLLFLRPISSDTKKIRLYNALDISCLFCSSLPFFCTIIPYLWGTCPQLCFWWSCWLSYPSSTLPQPNPLGHMRVHENTLLSPWLWWMAPKWAHCVNGDV